MSDIMPLSKETLSIFPYVTDKAIIDFVNGIQVAKELNTIQQQRLSLFNRIWDGISGQSTMRQANTNDHLIAGLESCQGLFNELSKDIEKHSVALITLNDRVQNLEQNVIELIDFTVDLKEEVADLKNEFNSQKRLFLAEQQMSRLMDKWAAGGMKQLSPIGRCYAVLDALYWGAFGNRLRQDKDVIEFLDNLRDKLIIRLQADLNVERDRDLIRDEWLRLPEKSNSELQEALAFQGDWCLDKPKDFPTTFSATQWNQLPSQARIEYQNIPFHMMDIERVTKRLISDRFEG